MNRKYGVVRTLVRALVFFLVFAIVGGYGLTEVKTETGKQGEWQEVLIDKGYSYTWCGNRQIILAGKIVDIYTKKVHQLPPEAGSHYYPGCLSDGRYVFFKKTPSKGENGSNAFVIYDTKTQQSQVLPISMDKWPSFSIIPPALISPDGRYLAWYSKGEIKLPGGEILTLVPVFENVENIMIVSKEPDPEKRGIQTIAWSPDSKKLILLIGTSHLDDLRGIPKQYLIMYDVLTNKRTALRLKFKNDHYGKIIKVSPDGNKLYIQAILGEGVKNYLYVLDLTKTGPDKSTVKPILLRKDVRFFDISSDNLIVFHTFPDPETPHKANIKDAGLYLADSGGKVIQRLTSNTIDLYPKFSKDGQVIAFRRTTVKSWNKAPSKGEGAFGLGMLDSVDSVYILLRKD